MTRRQILRHLELERLMGADFLPGPERRGEGPKARDPACAAEAAPAEVPWKSEWDEFRSKVLACTKCRLSKGRTNVVFGVGSLTSPVMFVGEGPGQNEDEQGEPFVGRAGRLLTKTLTKLGVRREQVYITNIVRCRPPDNRTPQTDEVMACIPYLFRMIKFMQPKIICTLGGPAAQTLLNTKTGITRLRGRVHEFNNMKIFPTFHPAYILRNMNNVGVLEADLAKVLREAGLLS